MKNKNGSLLVTTIFLTLLAVVYLTSGLGRPSPEEDVIKVADQTAPSDVLQTLEEQGYIKNKLTYHTVLFLSKFVEEIQPGGYTLSKNLNAVALHSSLVDPDYRYVSIIEGLRKEEIADRVGEVLEWSDEKTDQFGSSYPLCALTGREGRLAPGNYLMKSTAKIQSIQTEMEEEFEKSLIEHAIDPEDVDDEVLTLASLIQREAAGAHDARLVSGIIHNRLKQGMRLQIDATLQYVKGNDDVWWPIVESEDKYIDSPFNTYANDGLPPQPIANPSLFSINAAINPITTNCLFYLHDASGNIHCSSSYEGHKGNINSYLR